MKRYLYIWWLLWTALFAQTMDAQEKRSYKDIAFDYVLQNIESVEARPWGIKTASYDKMPNGDYIVKLTIERTLTRQEDRLVNNQIQAYGATFNVGVRNATVNVDYDQTKSYFVFVDRFGEPHKYMTASTDHEFHYWGNNAWLIMDKHNEKVGNKTLSYHSNINCFSNDGETMWSGRDMKIYGWAYTGNTLYMVGTLWNDGCSILRTVDIKTLKQNDLVGRSGVIPSDIVFEDKGVSITQYGTDGESATFSYPYAANDRQFQIDLLLKKHDMTKSSDLVALGTRYLNGDIVDKDERKAVELFEKAANKNSDIGMAKLAACYKKGVGVAQDNAKAFSLYERAADMGNTDAMITLSDMYAEGDGTDKNISKAMYWKEQLAFMGDLNAQKFVLANQAVDHIKCGIKADEVLKKARDSYKNNSYEWAKFCYERAISLGSNDAMLDYGKWLYSGDGITKDCNKAIEYLSKLGEEYNNSEAQNMLALIYHEGKGVAPNIKKEMYWMLKAADNGDVNAQLALGNAYQTGLGVKKDKKMSFTMYEKAAMQGNQDAIKEMVYCYANGNGVKKDVANSVVWFKKLDSGTQLAIAQAFEKGIDVKKNEAVAMIMYEYMVNDNNPMAGYTLVDLYIRNGGLTEAENLLARISRMPNIDQNANYSIGQYCMGMIWEKRGRRQQAINCYQNSNLPEAKERLSILKVSR